MNSPLFADSMEIESMFSPPLFVKTDDLAAVSPNFFDANGREPSDNTLSHHKSVMSHYAFPSVKGDHSETFPLSLGMDMNTSVPTCFPPSATLMCAEDIPSPQLDLSADWDQTISGDRSPIVQDSTNSTWLQSFENLAPDPRTRHQRRYGQLTPPDDFSPKTHETPEHPSRQALPEGSHGEKSTRKTSDANTTSVKRRSKQSSSKEGAPASITKRPRKGRRSTKGNNAVYPEEDVKRERFLERNRVAASKCRQKKKEWTESLEEDERQQKALNSYLTRYVAQLKEELLFLKGECLKHSDCECVAIREHMRNTIPFMTRPSIALYGARSCQPDDNRMSMSSMGDAIGSLSVSSSRLQSIESDISEEQSLEDDDMRSILAASLEQDCVE